MRAKPGGGSLGLTSDLPFDSPDSESRVRSTGGGGGRGGGVRLHGCVEKEKEGSRWNDRSHEWSRREPSWQRWQRHTWAGIPICSYFSSSSGFGLPLQQISEMGTLNRGRREFSSGYRHLDKRTLAQVIQLVCSGLRLDQRTGEFNWVSGAPERALGGKCMTGRVFRSCLKI